METRQRSPSRRLARNRPRVTPTIGSLPNVTRKSPSRRSPARKSPSRKSPARKSPSRKSPGRKPSPQKVEVKKDSPIGRKPSPKNLKIRLDKNITAAHLLKSTLSGGKSEKSSSHDTLDIGSSSPVKPDDSGDSEIAQITSVAQMRLASSGSKLKMTPTLSTHQLTPTPSVTATTELSRHSRSASRTIDESRTEYSDEDNERDSYSNYQRSEMQNNSYPLRANSAAAASRVIQIPKEFGGAIGCVLLIISMPLILYYLMYSCEKTTTCYFKKITSLPDFTTIQKIFTKDAVLAYSTYTLVIMFASMIPIGRTVRLPLTSGAIEYMFNSVFIASIITIAFIIGEYLKYPISDFILRNYIKFYIFNILSATSLSICCYTRVRYVKQPTILNPYAKTGNFIIDFSLGREINPKLFGIINIKLCAYRVFLISTLIMLEILLYKNLQIPKLPATLTTIATEANISSTLLDVSTVTTIAMDSAKHYYLNTSLIDFTSFYSGLLALIYILDLIYYEHHMATSFELQQEGVGALLLLRYAITPYLLISTPKYLFDKRPVQLPFWLLVLITITFITGLILKRLSNLIKYRYRLDPYNKDFTFIESVHTFQGKRLLLGKFWGTVRQPNYSGDILMLLSFVFQLYGKFAWYPFISNCLIISYLIHRAYRLNARNFQRYNSAWTRYCTKVRYIFIPKVF